MTKIKTDFAGALSIADAYSIKTGASYKVINMIGPGGGWPEIEVSGSIKEIEAFLLLQCGGDKDLVRECMEWNGIA
jgi:hypothetical protein